MQHVLAGGPFVSGRFTLVVKPSLSIPDLSALLIRRQLQGKPDQIMRALMDHGYFRLSGYWRYFQIDPANGLNDFETGTKLSDVLDIYATDAQLRNLLLEGMAEVETSLRAILVARICTPGGSGLEYWDPQTYDGESRDKHGDSHRAKLLADMVKDIERSKERHVMHHREKGGATAVPMYVAVEAFSFGTLSRMYGLLSDDSLKSAVARRYSYSTPAHFSTNIRAVAVFRNACAHHSRIWNRHIRQDVPRIWPGLVQAPLATRNYHKTAWGTIAVVADMVSQVRRDASFMGDIQQLISSRAAYENGLTNPSLK